MDKIYEKMIDNLLNTQKNTTRVSIFIAIFTSTYLYLASLLVSVGFFSNDKLVNLSLLHLKVPDEITIRGAMYLLLITVSILLINVIGAIVRIVLNNRDFVWKSTSGLQDWDFQGNIVIDRKEGAIHIIQSELGCVIKNRDWRNFDMSFEFKIPKTPVFSPLDEENNQFRRGFGIICRAKQLGQYYMLKIDIDGFKPHVRNIFWENNGLIAKTTLSQENLDQWLKAKLTISDNLLTMSIGDDNFSYMIPSYSTVHKEAIYPTQHEQKLESVPYSKISFRDSGSVGFRSAPLEEIYIKRLKVNAESSCSRLYGELKNILKFY